VLELPGFNIAVQGSEIKLVEYVGEEEEIVIPSEVKIPDNDFVFQVTTIGNSCFFGCSFIKKIDIPDSITEVGYGAFSGCKSMTSLEIPEGMENFNFWTFAGCESLKELILPSSCKNLDREGEVMIWFNAVKEVPNLGIVFNANKTALLYYPAQEISTHYDIPKGVTHIGNYAFCIALTFEISELKNMTFDSLVSVVIPNSVISIGHSAFSGCKSITNITIPNSVISIGSWAFSGCKSITNITIPENRILIGTDAFKGTSIESEILKNFSYTDTAIQKFEEQDYYKEHLPQSKEIPRALICCTVDDIQNIKDLVAELYWEGFNLHCESEANFQTIKESQCVLVFFSKYTVKCEKTMNFLKNAISAESSFIQVFLDDCDWPAEIKNDLHNKQAIFKNNCLEREFTGLIRDALRHFECTLGHPRGFDVKNLGDSVEIKKFHPTDYLHVVIPKTFFKDELPVSAIGYSAFSDNMSNKEGFKSIVLPNTLKTIGKQAFQWATKLETIVIPQGVTTIGECAFASAVSLRSINIPDSVINIGKGSMYTNIIFAKYGSVAWKYAVDNKIKVYDG